MRISCCIAFVLTVSVNFLFAAGGAIPGSGTPLDPYRIEDHDDFLAFIGDSAYWDDNIRLESDIDLAGDVFAEAPVAPDMYNGDSVFDDEATKFSGSFDGNGYVISNLTIDVFQGTTDDQANDFLALFGCLAQYAELKNIALENVTINAGNFSQHVAALCGKCDYMSSITDCYATGSITGQQYTTWVGGLVAVTQGIINTSFSTVDLTGGNYVGGFCAEQNIGGEIHNCWASGSVEEINPNNPNSRAGGFCGKNSNSAAIYKCYSTGPVSAGAADLYVGGFCGDNDSGTINNCFWDTETSGMETSPAATGKTTAQMKTLVTFKSNAWDFVNVWQMNFGSYPQLKPVFHIPGDLNVDKTVNILDFSIFAEHWLEAKSL